MNYEFNLLHHVGVVAKRVCAAAAAAETAAETAAHEGDDNTPSGLTGRGVKTVHVGLCHGSADYLAESKSYFAQA